MLTFMLWTVTALLSVMLICALYVFYNLEEIDVDMDSRMRYVGAEIDRGDGSVEEAWGMRCPKCGRDDALEVVVEQWAKLSANGTEPYGDQEWTPDSMCTCTNCDWSGKVSGATIGE